MDESRLVYLFHSYFNKTATSIECTELFELLTDAENDGLVKKILAETWQQFHTPSHLFNDNKADEMLANILEKAKGVKPAVVLVAEKRRYSWLRIAAAAAILVFAITGVYLWFKPGQSSKQIAHSKQINKDVNSAILPGGNKAILTLSDGSKIILDTTSSGTLSKQGNAKVIKLNTNTVAYNSGDDRSQEIVYNTLSTPPGGQYQLILQDGTNVWLNASSSIYFPITFKGKERSVTITGEVYFEVAKNAAMPFKITVKDAEIQVLGTHFNIMAYDDENSINTTLLEGSIKISHRNSNRVLIPGQESRINKAGDIRIVDANIEEVMAWKNGWFQFNSYDIEKVMRQISRWYNVQVVYEGKIPTGHFSGSVSRENDISKVMKILNGAGIQYRIEGRKIIIFSK